MSAITTSQKKIITASIPFLKEHGVDLTANFYKYMLETHPEVRPFFNKSHQITKKQPKILAFSLVKYAENINDLTPLLGFVRQIVEKHVGLQVTPEQYDIVGSCLLKTLKEMVGEGATDEFMEAWKVAYYDLANILIDLEKKRYATELTTKDAWLGFKDATVSKIVQESDSVKSVYIKPNDEKLANFYPGQYTTIRISTDNGATVQSREYSLSNEYPELQNGLQYYRISVRRIPGGVVSNYIHDQLKVGDAIKISSPYGKLLEPHFNAVNESKDDSKPVVFFIGGIGITPSISSIEYFLKQGKKVQLYLSNSDLNSRPFGNWLDRLTQEYPTLLSVDEFISTTAGANINNTSNYHIHPRRVSAKDLAGAFTNENVQNNDYYLIGPLGYMGLVTEFLQSKGLDVATINSEQYGPVAV